MAAKKKSPSKRATSKSPSRRPKSTLPARYVLAAVVALAFLVSFPLFTVWKQVYITSSARTMEQLADSVAVLNKERTRLRLVAEQLGDRERIERLARTDLGLKYPDSQEMVVLRKVPRLKRSVLGNWRLLAVLRKSLGRDKS